MKILLLVLGGWFVVTPVVARHHVPLPRPAPNCTAVCTPNVERDEFFSKMATDLASLTPVPNARPSVFVLPLMPTLHQTSSPPQEKRKHPMMQIVREWLAAAGWSGVALAALCLYFIVRHGFPWFWAKVTSIFNSAREDVTWLDGRVTVLEGTLGITPIAKPSAAVKPPVVAPVPVLTKADVDAAVKAALATQAPAAPAVPTAAA